MLIWFRTHQFFFTYSITSRQADFISSGIPAWKTRIHYPLISISWLKCTYWLKEPGHHQPWHCPKIRYDKSYSPSHWPQTIIISCMGYYSYLHLLTFHCCYWCSNAQALVTFTWNIYICNVFSGNSKRQRHCFCNPVSPAYDDASVIPSIIVGVEFLF